jgi:ketosteroid isomerase-like protein
VVVADRRELARRSYEAYETGDRGVLEELLTDDFTFFSPADVGIDRATYFERCWPIAERSPPTTSCGSSSPETR